MGSETHSQGKQTNALTKNHADDGVVDFHVSSSYYQIILISAGTGTEGERGRDYLSGGIERGR